MAEGLDTGLTKIDRIQNKMFESATRVIFNCNPRHPTEILGTSAPWTPTAMAAKPSKGSSPR